MSGYIIQLDGGSLVKDSVGSVICFPERAEADSELEHTFHNKGKVLPLVKLWRKRGRKKKEDQ